MCRVYFGPYSESPVDLLRSVEPESKLQVGEFEQIRHIARDFWTNNPFILDVFPADRVMVWDDSWVPLTAAVQKYMPDQAVRKRRACCGKLAMAVEMLRAVRFDARANDLTDDEIRQAQDEIARAMFH